MDNPIIRKKTNSSRNIYSIYSAKSLSLFIINDGIIIPFITAITAKMSSKLTHIAQITTDIHANTLISKMSARMNACPISAKMPACMNANTLISKMSARMNACSIFAEMPACMNANSLI
ncbi:hypothetical protein ACFQI7_17605 [Paenibacillus allorhizosphaerae]|uniref:Uncharacterized protein n=1 Tax=Paenibacillus allorhizosphaerae TaxID=2849866 RepID=A0ABM8VFA1_9BACL|nr:hypothetical protein [Paenibacillus allorhizosphaerae]CAG7631975.1 hypothetical protein PAECIP111802_01800 [Paenibacillus allorhizosphaerae]